MGRPKPLLPLGERSYLEVVVDKLREGGADPVVAVLGCRAARVRQAVTGLPARLVINDRWRRGMLSSIQAGLRALEEAGGESIDSMLLAPVDIPAFAPASVRAVIEARGRTGAPIVLPEHDGRHGHPALFGREVWGELMVPDLEGGARSVVDAHRSRLRTVAVDDPWILEDADTPEEHERITREAGRDRREPG